MFLLILMCSAVISVCKSFKDQVLLLEEPLRGVAPMLTAVRKLQSSTEHLTTLHPKFLLLCLLAKCYKTGLSILEEDTFEVDKPRDLYLYYYYGGMICIRQKSFQRALELLHNVVTAPMSTINAIAVEAYKKYILISLIHHGRWGTEPLICNHTIPFSVHAGRERQRFDFDDFDSVPQRFNIGERVAMEQFEQPPHSQRLRLRMKHFHSK
ncbi:COP9 signalosome complex subunit 3-like [Gossypium australe]|uniref:COP9 signalosome complex subunit 3-like n=1 Tax=Gossypium australe TaxID=47621 RepID=A0A5B6VX13_9ROSI|nr:COP9 signalosome complex subunit 3-like [Gossypium australe]